MYVLGDKIVISMEDGGNGFNIKAIADPTRIDNLGNFTGRGIRIAAFNLAWDEEEPYDLICLDIMMPELHGQEGLRKIREIERARGIKPIDEVKVIMTMAMSETRSVIDAFYLGGATSYLLKPTGYKKVHEELKSPGLMHDGGCGAYAGD